MAKITRSLSRRTNTAGTSEIMLRVTISRTQQLRIKSGIFVSRSRFKDGRFVYPRANQKEVAALHEIETRLQELEKSVIELCISNDEITRTMLDVAVDRFHNPSKYDNEPERTNKAFFSAMEQYLAERERSHNSRKLYLGLARTLARYEAYRKGSYDADYCLTLDGFTTEELNKFVWFMRNEHTLYDEYKSCTPDLPTFLQCREYMIKTTQRGENTINTMLVILGGFFNWCNFKGLTENRPFERYTESRAQTYGTPFYLTIDERNKVADFDLSEHPDLAVQRDIFIFQCLVGCRVSDLYNFTSGNIVGDFLEYVPQKTENERKDIVRVPLKQQAKDIIERYKDEEGERLFPFTYVDKYNACIREFLKLCGIDRVVTIINPKTGKDERKPIYEVASSHMARRTFIGNLYKKVKDPNLVGSMSGHKEGSKAFARYREIDDDIKRDVIDLI